MKQTISYAGLDGKAKDDKAIKDVKFYLSGSKGLFTKVCGHLKNDVKNEQQGFFLLEMVGIKGFPAKVMLERYSKLYK